MWVGAGEIDHEIGLGPGEHRRQMLGEQREKMLITSAVGQLDVE